MEEDTQRAPGDEFHKDQLSKKRLWVIVGVFAFLLVATIAYLGPLEIIKGIWISLSEDTEYAPDYTESGFREISIGDSETSVKEALGAPIREDSVEPSLRWLYTPHPEPVEAFGKDGEYPDIRFSFTTITFDEKGMFESAFGQISHGSTSTGSSSATIFGDGNNSLTLTDAQIAELKAEKATPDEIEAMFGKPQAVFDAKTVKWLKYSHSPGSKDYRQRLIGIDRTGKVCRKVDAIWWD